MTKVLHHDPGVDEIYPGLWKPICGCGWKGKQPQIKQAVAQKIADQHADLKGCGKKRFPSKAEADQALLDAKIARGLEFNKRRRETYAYLCPTCPGPVWHLTSKGRR